MIGVDFRRFVEGIEYVDGIEGVRPLRGVLQFIQRGIVFERIA